MNRRKDFLDISLLFVLVCFDNLVFLYPIFVFLVLFLLSDIICIELASNGSLWDALRQPLNPPYTVADGKTRNAWPLSIYQSVSVSADLQISTTPEFGAPVPFGTSPYVQLAPEGSW
jgi:hypothetical protein